MQHSQKDSCQNYGNVTHGSCESIFRCLKDTKKLSIVSIWLRLIIRNHYNSGLRNYNDCTKKVFMIKYARKKGLNDGERNEF